MRIPPISLVMRVTLALLLAPPCAGRAADASAEAARSYRVETEGTTRQVAADGKGRLVLVIVPVKGAHVHPEAPLKITLVASAGLELAKAELGRADAVDPKADGPRFEVPFSARIAGAQEARARLEFFICSDQWCVRQSRELALAIDVK